MKKLIITLAVATVALAGALHAADTKTAATDKDKGSCCDKAKATSGSACCGEKTACSKTPSKGVAMSPKAAEQASR